jgi:hypothetical protein
MARQLPLQQLGKPDEFEGSFPLASIENDIQTR